MDTVALAQYKANERKAAEYVAKVERKRKIEKRKKAVIGTFLAAFFVVLLAAFLGAGAGSADRALTL